MAAKTVFTYCRAARSLAAWLEEKKGITAAADVDKSLLSLYFAWMTENGGRDGTGREPGGVSVDYWALQQFLKWPDEVEGKYSPSRWRRCGLH